MTYAQLLKRLQKLSPKELTQPVSLYYADGGWYSTAVDISKTVKNNEILGCEIVDPPSNWEKGRVYIAHSC